MPLPAPSAELLNDLAADHHRCILAADHHRCLVLLQDVDVVSEVFELGAQRRCGCPD